MCVARKLEVAEFNVYRYMKYLVQSLLEKASIYTKLLFCISNQYDTDLHDKFKNIQNLEGTPNSRPEATFTVFVDKRMQKDT